MNTKPKTWPPTFGSSSRTRSARSPRVITSRAWDALTRYFIPTASKPGSSWCPPAREDGHRGTLAARSPRARRRPVLWLAHKRTLLRQAFNTFRFLGNVARPKSALDLICISSEIARGAT